MLFVVAGRVLSVLFTCVLTTLRLLFTVTQCQLGWCKLIIRDYGHCCAACKTLSMVTLVSLQVYTTM